MFSRHKKVVREKPMLEGYLLKRAVKSGRNWKKRYFALYDTKLVYWTKKGDKTERGEMVLTEDFFVSDTVIKKFGFMVSDFKTTYYLAANKQELKDFWMHAIARIIRKLQQDIDYFGVKGIKGVKVAAANLPLTEEQRKEKLRERMLAYQNSQSLTGPGLIRSGTSSSSVVGEQHLSTKLQQSTDGLDKEKPPISQGKHESVTIPETSENMEILSPRESVKTPARESVKTPARESVKSPARESVKSPARESVKSPARESVKSPARESVKSPARESVKSPARESVKTPARESVETPARESVKAPSPRESVKSPVRSSTKYELSAVVVPSDDDSDVHSSADEVPELDNNTIEFPPPPTKKPSGNKLLSFIKQNNSTDDVTIVEESKTSLVKSFRNSFRKKPSEKEIVVEEPPKQPVQPPKSVPKKEVKVKKAKGGIANRVALWQKKADDYQEGQAGNVFSGAYKGGGKVLRPGDEGYGKAQEGSKTEARAKAAADWVDKEINKLVGVIEKIGNPDPAFDGKVSTTFGPLFLAYQDISDSLVGILMRAKRRKRLWYEGDMLFQGMHDKVKIHIL